MVDQKYTKEKGCISSIPKTYYIFYRTENLVTGKYYYGVHATDKLQDGYLGSGKVLKKAIRKYGKDSFVRKDLEFFENALAAYTREAEVVTEDLVLDPRCYNAKPGGLGGLKGMISVCDGNVGWKVHPGELEELLKNPRIRVGNSLKGRPSKLRGRKQSPEHIRRRSEALKGHAGYPGKPKPVGFGEKIRQARLGQKGNTSERVSVWKDGNRFLIHPEDLTSYLREGWLRTTEYRCLRCGCNPVVYVVPVKKVQRYLGKGFVKTTYASTKGMNREFIKVLD